MVSGIYELTLRSSDGREKHILAWLPTEETRREFYAKAERNGIEIIANHVGEVKSEKRKMIFSTEYRRIGELKIKK